MTDPRLERARQALAAAEQSAAAGDPGAADVPEPVRGDAEPDAFDVARQIVLRQLSHGPRTRKQLEDKLRQRGCEDEVATAVLDRMTEVGLVDDAAYAEMLVRSRQETKGLATRALGHELRRKGVPDELVEAALEDVDAGAERDRARALVERRLRSLHGLERGVQTRRLAGFLARKGYDAGLAYQVIREALDASPEHRRD